ncbi:hypothetical protein SAMN05216330_12531 [Bradyrhizobium sp. Ghvi]|nr:hypothetical protein SAMN05216330_12531 [Bradyrhizobium sp. Ghvi]
MAGHPWMAEQTGRRQQRRACRQGDREDRLSGSPVGARGHSCRSDQHLHHRPIAPAEYRAGRGSGAHCKPQAHELSCAKAAISTAIKPQAITNIKRSLNWWFRSNHSMRVTELLLPPHDRCGCSARLGSRRGGTTGTQTHREDTWRTWVSIIVTLPTAACLPINRRSRKKVECARQGDGPSARFSLATISSEPCGNAHELPRMTRDQTAPRQLHRVATFALKTTYFAPQKNL